MRQVHERKIKAKGEGEEMSLFEVGRLAVKIAGRDGGKTCVIVDKIDEHFVVVDGQTRRRKCNIRHLEPLPQIIQLKKGASHEEVKGEFKKMGLEVWETKPKPKTERPRKKRKERLEARKEEREKKEEEKKKVKEEKAKEKKASSFEEAVEKEARKEGEK